MSRRLAWIVSGLVAAGCQAPQTVTPPAAPVASAPPAVAPPAAAVEASQAPADPRAKTAANLVEAQAAAIAAAAAQPAEPNKPTPSDAAAPSHDVTVIEPGRPATPKPPVPAVVPPKPPAVAAVERAIAVAPPAPAKPPADDGFRPVPPMSAAPVATDVAVTPPPDPAITSPTPPPTPAVVPPPVAGPASAPPTVPAESPRPPADPLEQRLMQKAREYPRDLGPQLDAQMLLWLKDEKVPTADAMAGLNLEDRDVLTSMLDGLTNFRNQIRQDNNLLITRKIQPLTDMADRLRSRAELSIVNASLCRTIRGFGNYDAMQPARMTAGVNNRPKLYFEVENITPRLDPNNMWSTVMRLDLTLFDEAGVARWNVPNVPVTDLCRNRRRDFFFARVLDLPVGLQPGNYTLKITLTDEVARRVSEKGLPLSLAPLANTPAAVPQGTQGLPLQMPTQAPLQIPR